MPAQIYTVDWSKFEELMNEIVKGTCNDIYNGAPCEVESTDAKDALRTFVEKIVTDLRGY
jgi:hypothetical protein